MERFNLEAKATSLAPFREKLRSRLKTAGFDEKTCYNILLSVDEVLANVIRHAYGSETPEGKSGKIQVTFSDFDDRAEIQIEDGGPSFDPRSVPAPELPSKKPGGLGIYLFRTLMDKVDYEVLRPQGNRLRLVKYKGGERGKSDG